MKKIAFITDKVYPYFVGGQEKRIYEFSKILNSSDNFEVSIVSMKWWNGGEIKKIDGITYIAICPKLEIYKKDGKRNTISSIRFGLATFFYVLKSKQNILDIDIFPYFPLNFARFAMFFKEKKAVISCYWVEYWGKNYWKKYYKNTWFLGVWLEQISFWACDKIVADSEFTKKQLETAFCNKEQKQIISIPPVSIDVDKIENIVAHKKIYDIIYYGRIIEHKHVEYIVDTVKNLNDSSVKALIIGNGPDEQKIKVKIKSENLSNQIKMIDFVDSYDELIKNIKSAKIMIQPSEREGFGITVVEANACGLPVLVMDFPDNAAKELIDDNVNGFICKNKNQLYSKIKEILQNEDMLAQMSKNSKESAKKYSRKIMSKRMLSYYKKL